MEYTERNHNQLAHRVYADLATRGYATTSRSGPVLRLPGVVTLVATQPRERVSFCSLRDANPFWSLVRAMAMLASQNSVDLMAYMCSPSRTFSDDGERYNAFYGERLRVTWGDQINAVIHMLRFASDSREAVAQIWDPLDLTKDTRDKAHELCLLFSREGAVLSMTSLSRSNDATVGILNGPSSVTLSFFHEYVACALGCEVGAWTHVTSNLHVYTESPRWHTVREGASVCVSDYYAEATGAVGTTRPLFDFASDRGRFDAELLQLVAGCVHAARYGDAGNVGAMHRSAVTPFIREVVVPVFMAWHVRQTGGTMDDVKGWLSQVVAPDWHLACSLWLTRRAWKGAS